MIRVTSFACWIVRMKIGIKRGRHLRNELVRVNQLETIWGGIKFPLSVSITHISFCLSFCEMNFEGIHFNQIFDFVFSPSNPKTLSLKIISRFVVSVLFRKFVCLFQNSGGFSIVLNGGQPFIVLWICWIVY